MSAPRERHLITAVERAPVRRPTPARAPGRARTVAVAFVYDLGALARLDLVIGGDPVEEQAFTHLDGEGKVRMVDVSQKDPTRRSAEASCVVRSRVDAFTLAGTPGALEPVFAARLSGIQAAKRTSQLIPLCHPINLSDVHVEVEPRDDGALVRATVVTVNRTGVEMEALTACSFAALSLLNVLVEVDADARVEDLVLLGKSGGKSADWGRLVAEPNESESH